MASDTEGAVAGLLANLVGHLVDDPEHVEVFRSKTGGSVLYEIAVGRDDYGKVIGRGGRVANAIRAVAGAVGGACGERVRVDIQA
jgi:predicted RNA-binding protein YlqC (UPF0109 family)